MEDKKRYGRIKHAPYSLDLAQFDFALFPLLKSDQHGKRFSDLDDQLLKKKTTWFGDIYGNEFIDTANANSTRESILRNCAVRRIDDVILL